MKNGDLTQKQADAIKARLGNGKACAGGFEKGIGGVGRIGMHPAINPKERAGAATLTEIATALGISEEELRQDLQSGKTLKDIAASKGMDEATFRSKLVAAVKADLDKQVSAGKLTQQGEDMIVQRLQNGPLPLWDKSRRVPIAPATPSPATTST